MADFADWVFLGSAPDCEVRLSGSGVAAYHARCRLEPNGRLRLEDLGTPGGTSINQPGNRCGVTYLSLADTIYLGAAPVPAAAVIEAWRRRTAPPPGPPSNPPPGPPAQKPDVQELRLAPGVTVFGRDPEAMNRQKIVLSSPMASRSHAGLLRTPGGEYYIWDLGSTYGTFVNSRRIGSQRSRLNPSDVIDIAGYRFSIGGQGEVKVAAALRDGTGIRADGVAAEVGGFWTRRLNLAGVRLAVEPRTMLALMGPSGAGKTTLLRILAGQARPKAGLVYYNDLELYSQFDQVRTSLGYVPQEDILHPQLTVRQALFFSARLRLPTDYQSTEIRRRVEETMTRLGIAGQADVRIGSAERRGISGGQRKRANLGMELLADPSVLLLDEPTSGLSSSDAERVVRTLRELADEGRTVVVTIHQPPPHVLAMFDRLAVIDNDTVRTSPAPPPQPGRLIYLGPARMAAAYFQSQDPSGGSKTLSGADALFAAIEHNPSRKTEDWEASFRASNYYREHVEKPLAQPPPPMAARGKPRNLPSPLHQFSTLLERVWHIKAADSWSMWQMFVFQPLLVAAGIALASGTLHTDSSYAGVDYIKDFLRVGKTLFFAAFTAIWFGCNNTAREIVGEIAVYRRERRVGLSLGAYLSSKLAFFAGVCAIQCMILIAVCSTACDLKANPLWLLTLFWLAAMCGVSIGLLISALAPEGERAVQLVPLVLLPMILFGGGVTRLADLDSDFARNIPVVMPTRWAFEGALLTENAGRPVSLATAPAMEDRYTIVNHYFSESPHNGHRIWQCAGTLAAFAAVTSALAALSLRLRDGA